MTEVGTHIIAANINGQDVEGLIEPVIITLQLNIREGVSSSIAKGLTMVNSYTSTRLILL